MAEYRIKYLSLQKAELTYEVAIRGCSPAETVLELRKQIVKLTASLPASDILESGLDATEDIKGATDSILKAQSHVISLKAKFDDGLFERTDNLCNHIYHRLRRIIPETPVAAESLKNCSNKYQLLCKELADLRPGHFYDDGEDFEQDGPAPQDTNGSANNSAPSSPRTPTKIAVTCDRGMSSDFSKLKYNGKTCVRAFVQRVKEFLAARNLKTDKFLLYATEIFQEDALHWYRSVRESITNWHDLSTQLIAVFSQHDYDYRLKSEIRARTQGENENITIYLSIMHGMFSRLTVPLTDEEQLEIVLHNIRPCFATVIATAGQIDSIDSLRKICHNYEAVHARMSQFREPPRPNSDTLAPEFAFNKQSSSSFQSSSKQPFHNKYTTEVSPSTNASRPNYSNFKKRYPVNALSAQNSNNNSNKLFCLRCRTHTHTLRDCKAPRAIICFKCGLPGVKSIDCSKCNKAKPLPSTSTSKN